MWCGAMRWCGVVCGVVWCGVVWRGVVRKLWCGALAHALPRLHTYTPTHRRHILVWLAIASIRISAFEISENIRFGQAPADATGQHNTPTPHTTYLVVMVRKLLELALENTLERADASGSVRGSASARAPNRSVRWRVARCTSAPYRAPGGWVQSSPRGLGQSIVQDRVACTDLNTVEWRVECGEGSSVIQIQ